MGAKQGCCTLISKIDDIDAEKIWKQIDQATMQFMKMSIIHKAMLYIWELLNGCGSVDFEVTAEGGEI